MVFKVQMYRWCFLWIGEREREREREREGGLEENTVLAVLCLINLERSGVLC